MEESISLLTVPVKESNGTCKPSESVSDEPKNLNEEKIPNVDHESDGEEVCKVLFE